MRQKINPLNFTSLPARNTAAARLDKVILLLAREIEGAHPARGSKAHPPADIRGKRVPVPAEYEGKPEKICLRARKDGLDAAELLIDADREVGAADGERLADARESRRPPRR